MSGETTLEIPDASLEDAGISKDDVERVQKHAYDLPRGEVRFKDSAGSLALGTNTALTNHTDIGTSSNGLHETSSS